MQENKLTIVIEKPIGDVFLFSINPENTPKWIKGIKKEETSEWPVKIDSRYKNCNYEDIWSEYVVENFEENNLFQLGSIPDSYHVRYDYKSISKDVTLLEYTEWMNSSELENPLNQEALNLLKDEIEKL